MLFYEVEKHIFKKSFDKDDLACLNDSKQTDIM